MLLRHPSPWALCHHDSKYKLRAKRLQLYGSLRNMAKTLIGMSRLIPPPYLPEYAPASASNGFLSRLENRENQYKEKESIGEFSRYKRSSIKRCSGKEKDDVDFDNMKRNDEERVQMSWVIAHCRQFSSKTGTMASSMGTRWKRKWL